MKRYKKKRAVLCRTVTLFVLVGLLAGLLPGYAFADDPVSISAEDTAYHVSQVSTLAAYLKNSTTFGTRGGGFPWDSERKSRSWTYYNGIMMDAFLMLDTAGNYGKVNEYYNANINSQGKVDSSGSSDNYYRENELDSIAPTRALFDLLRLPDNQVNSTAKQKYKKMIDYVYSIMLNFDKIASAGNNFKHKMNNSSWATYQVALDGLYMAQPYFMEVANALDEGLLSSSDFNTYSKTSLSSAAIYNDVVQRMTWIADNLYHTSNHLYNHGWGPSAGVNGQYWLRAVGWYAAALADVISMLPDSYSSQKQTLIAKETRLFDGMMEYQDAGTGMWYNVINRGSDLVNGSNRNKYETSGSALLAYAMMKSYAEGYIGASYGEAGLRAFNGTVANKLTVSGSTATLHDTYLSSGVETTPEGYLKKTYNDNEAKGVGPLIMASVYADDAVNKLGADAVTSKIAAIGTVAYTTESKAKIDDARDSYDALTAAQKALVTNYAVLTAAETAYAALEAAAQQSSADQAAADAVTSKIAAIGTVAYTTESKAKIDDARDSYDALTAAQKALVTNYAVLTAAETAYAALEAAAQQSSADQAAADAVTAKIAAIGEVVYTAACKAKINNARSAYNALTADQKALVTNYAVLTAAETRYAELEASQTTIDPEDPVPAGYHRAVSTETVYELYTPGASGEIIEPGRYILYNAERGYVVSGQEAVNGGITASTHFTIDGDRIFAPATDVMTFVGIEGRTNQYYLHNSEGKYVSIYPAANQGAATLNALPVRLAARLVDGSVEICEEGLDYALNAYPNIVFGVDNASGSSVNRNNLFTLYREVRLTTDIAVPDYPAEHSVGLFKEANAVDNFQDTGLAEVQLSLAAVPPYFSTGVDVLFITDISNSMAWKAGTQRAPVDGETSKLQDMQAAVSAFTDAIMGPNEGSAIAGNNTVTFCTFGGWDADRNGNASTHQGSYIDPTRTLITASADPDAVKTAVNNITFNMTDSNTYYLSFDGRKYSDATHKGYGNTVYDYGFMEGYQAALSIKQAYQAETGEAYSDSGRQIFVIFISDGAPTNYNGKMYKNPGGPLADGYYSATDVTGGTGGYSICNYGGVDDIDARQQLWFDYISTTPHTWATKLFNMDQVAGMDTIGIDFLHGGFQAGNRNIGNNQTEVVYWIFTPGSDMDLGYVLSSLVEGETLSILTADDQDELANSLAEEAKRVSTLASYVSVDDRMGAQYDLQRAAFITNPVDGSQVPLSSYSVRPSITVSRYPTVHYTAGGANDHVGEITGDPAVLEQVTFSDDGGLAYSTLINNSQTNILTDSGVIRAHYFYYNTNGYDVDIDGLVIPAESFSWNVAKLMEDRLTLTYYVKLEGSEDYSAPDGLYETNESASVTYRNHDGVTVTDYFEKPELPWESHSYITVIKKWTDNDAAHDPITVQVVFEAPDGTRTNVTEPVALSEENNWRAEVLTDLSHLPEAGVYKAVDDADGYYDISGQLKTRLAERNGQIVRTNHLEITLYNTPEGLTSFDVTKTWSDSAIDDHADDPVEVELFCNGVTTGRTAVLNADNDWSCTFNDLPLTVDGVKAVYAAQEITQMEDYVSVPGVVTDVNAADVPANATIVDDGSRTGVTVYVDAQGYAHAVMPAYEQIIRNVIGSDLLRLRICKKWSDYEYHDPVTVSVGYRFADGTEQTLRSGIALAAEDGWTALVSLHRPEGEGEFFVTEQNIPEGYVSMVGEPVYTDEHTAEVSVYNVDPDAAKSSVTANKVWTDGDALHTGEAVEVELYINEAPSGRTALLSADNGWSYTFGGLAVKDDNGVAYSYGIRENTASALYTASYSAVTVLAPAAPSGYTLVVDGGSAGISVFESVVGSVLAAAPAFDQTVTNTPVPDVDTVSLTVNKTWADTLASHGPVDCVVGYEAADGSVTVVSAGFTLSADTDWSREIEVAACDTDTGRYVLLEPTVDGYEPVTGDLQSVDTTETVTVYVPADSITVGGQYVFMTVESDGNRYVLGRSSDGYLVPKANGYTFMSTDNGDPAVTVEGQTYNDYFTAVPDDTVFTYTSNYYLENDGRYVSATGARYRDGDVYCMTSGPMPVYFNRPQNTTYKFRMRIPVNNTNMFVYFSPSNMRTTSGEQYGTQFRVYKKAEITVGSAYNAITATNFPRLGNQTVVIDYGLPVQVSVAAYYETLGVTPVFAGFGAPGAQAFSATDTLPEGYSGSSAVYVHGTAAYADGKLTYTPTDMTMSEKEVVNLAFSLEADGKTWYLYGSVAVVPATVMYYEDDFVTFEDTAQNQWQIVTGDNDGVYQAADYPGFDEALAALDANNVYGYDDANISCTTYSNGKAHRVNVKNGDYAKNGKKWPTATFTFTGIAFDLISVTARETGYIYIDIYQGTEAAGTKYKRWVVDTYYGFTRARDGYIQHEWYWAGKWYVRNTVFHEGEELPEIPEDQVLPSNIQDVDTSKTYKTYEINYTWETSEGGGSLYQIPVIKSPDLPYGTYTVVVTAAYSTFFDHTAPIDPATGKRDYTNGNYDFIFDAVRTYAPAADYEGYNKEYYTKDGEGWPQFLELRQNIISEAEAARTGSHIRGAVFFDSMASGQDDGSDLNDYENYGPDNEVYLAPGQSISFALHCLHNGKAVDTVQIGAKKLTGDTVELTASHTAADNEEEDLRTIEIIASSDMYYNVGDNLNWQNDVSDIVTLTNVGQAMVSVTNIKITYKEVVGTRASFAPMSRRMIKRAASAADAAYLAGRSECFHRYAFTVTAVPTETAPGVVTAVCPDCGSTFEIEIPALTAEGYEITGGFSATPEQDGWVEYTWKADANGVTASFRVALPAFGEYLWASGDGVDPEEFAEPAQQDDNEDPPNQGNNEDPPNQGDTENPSNQGDNQEPDEYDAEANANVHNSLEKLLTFFRNIIKLISKLFGKG